MKLKMGMMKKPKNINNHTNFMSNILINWICLPLTYALVLTHLNYYFWYQINFILKDGLHYGP